MQPRYTFRIDMNRPFEEIEKNFSKTTKQRISKAESLNTKVRLGTIDDVLEFSHLMDLTENRKDFVSHNYEYYKSLYEIYNQDNKMDLFIGSINVKDVVNTYEKEKEEILKALEEFNTDSLSKSAKTKKNELENLDNAIKEVKKDYYSSIKTLEDAIISKKSDKKIAYLTFDDGPYYNTYEVLKVLEKYNAKATFFTTTINGEYCYDKKSENCYLVYKEYLKYGHTIANHTFTHAIRGSLYKSTDNFITAVKNQENQVKEQTGGYLTNIVRFPGGSSTAKGLKQPIITELRKMNYGWVDWSAQDGDGGNLKTKEQAWSIFTSTIDQNLEVVLLHDYSKITLSILPDMIEYLQSKGYVLLPLFYDSNMINK